MRDGLIYCEVLACVKVSVHFVYVLLQMPSQSPLERGQHTTFKLTVSKPSLKISKEIP